LPTNPTTKQSKNLYKVLFTAWNAFSIYIFAYFLGTENMQQDGVLKLQPSSFCLQTQQQNKVAICTSFIHNTMECF
jgi:hypothetical protein